MILASLAVTAIAAHHSFAQDSRQSTNPPVYLPPLPPGQTDASLVSALLASLREPSLLEAAKDATVRSFRVSYFSPVPRHETVIRIVVNPDGSGQVISAVSSGTQADIRRTTSNVSEAEVGKLLQSVDKAGFWAAVSNEPPAEKVGRRPYVFDGTWWMLEGVQNGSFHYVFRRNPTPTPITEIGCYLSRTLAAPNGSVIPMPGCAPTIQPNDASTHR